MTGLENYYVSCMTSDQKMRYEVRYFLEGIINDVDYNSKIKSASENGIITTQGISFCSYRNMQNIFYSLKKRNDSRFETL